LVVHRNLAKLLSVQDYDRDENAFDLKQPDLDVIEPPGATFPFSPNNPPWGSFIAVMVWLASIAFILFVPYFCALPYLLSLNIKLEDKAGLLHVLQNDPTAILISIAAVIPAHILTLALSWVVVTNANKYSFKEILGWRWAGFNIWTSVAIIGLFYIFAAVLANFLPEQDNDFLRMLRSSRSVVYVAAFLATFTAPLVEEVIYRGVLYSAFQRSIGTGGAVALVTTLFALIHVPQYYPSAASIILICVLSLTLTLIRARTKNLLPCIALHMVFNGTQALLLILAPFFEAASDQATK
jgi:uncharacterized protein